MEKDISNITWLLVNTEIQDLLIKSALEFGKNKDRLEYKFIATIPIIIFISFVKVLYYYFFQFLVKYNGSNNTISAIILKVGRGYDQNNIYKVANINVNECIYIEAFNFKEFMSVERVSFFALIKAFIRSLNDYYLALKLAPTVVIRKILFRNSTKYIHSYSYLTTFFQQIKFKYEGCTIYSGGAAFAFDAAIRAKLKTEYMHHGLMNKVYPDVVSNYGSIYVYSKDEAVYLKRTGVNSNIYTYRYSKIESKYCYYIYVAN